MIEYNDDDDETPNLALSGFKNIGRDPVVWCNGNRHIRVSPEGNDTVTPCDCPIDEVMKR